MVGSLHAKYALSVHRPVPETLVSGWLATIHKSKHCNAYKKFSFGLVSSHISGEIRKQSLIPTNKHHPTTIHHKAGGHAGSREKDRYCVGHPLDVTDQGAVV